jgi:2-hydroxycyclohexanecarboxyl-CoA dehydrogenase
MDLELKGKSVIVTGGGSNIGRAITLGFAQEGANITLGEIDEEQGKKVAEQARAMGAAGFNLVKTDVTDFGQVQSMVRSANETFGTVDVLVNTAGNDLRAARSPPNAGIDEEV